MTKRYEKIQAIELNKLFRVDNFRLIREEHRKVPGGISEIAIKVDLKKDFAKKLNFKTPWDGELYAFVNCKKVLFKTTGYDNTKKITISEWDEKFVVIFEDNNVHEEPIYSIDKVEFKHLLENCRKPDTLV